jgi:hypothetical protein
MAEGKQVVVVILLMDSMWSAQQEVEFALKRQGSGGPEFGHWDMLGQQRVVVVVSMPKDSMGISCAQWGWSSLSWRKGQWGI